jgi:hypothetical protein
VGGGSYEANGTRGVGLRCVNMGPRAESWQHPTNDLHDLLAQKTTASGEASCLHGRYSHWQASRSEEARSDMLATTCARRAADDVYVERCPRLEKVTDDLFEGEEAVLHVIERIVAPLGLRVDATSPWVDARLPDGSRTESYRLITHRTSRRGFPITLVTASRSSSRRS